MLSEAEPSVPRRAVTPTAFPALEPILSHLSTRSPPPRNDGFDNFPAYLPSDPVELERRLTQDPDITRQMAMDDDDVGPPPDGGREAWSVVASVFSVSFCVYGFVTCFGQLQVYYLAHQLEGYSKSTVSWIASVMLTVCFGGSAPVGRYFDAHGARGLVIVGTSLNIGSLLANAFCKEYYQFMLSHLLFGISGALLWAPSTAVIGHWFLRKRGTASGIAVCGSGLGGIIYPIMLRSLFERIGFRDTMCVIAGMNAVLMLPSWFFLRARLPPRTPPPLKALRGPWKEPRYIFLVLGCMLVMMNWPSPFFNAPVLATSNSVSTTTINYSITFLQIGSFLGRGTSGFLADKFGIWRVFITTSAGCGVAILAFWTGHPLPEPVVVIGLVLYGYASGAWITLVAPSTGAISPTKELGMRVGMLWSLAAIPLLAGPVACGQLVMMDNNRFTYAGIFCGVSFLLGSAVTISPRAVEMLVTRLHSTSQDVEAGRSEKGSTA